MKHYLLISMAATAVILTACGGEKKQESKAELDTLEQKVSYIVGYNMASQAKASDFDIDVDAMSLAITDVSNDKESRLDEEESQAAMTAFQTQQQAKQEQVASQEATENLETGEAYLAENAEKEGVETTESGLQYRVLAEGDGPSPSEDDQVTVHYTGRLIDGTVFDSSVERGEPATFPVSGVIPGWVEALQMMQVGDKWEITIPSDLAYGPGGTSGPIGPNETLIFEVELLSIGADDEEGNDTESDAATDAE